MDTNDSATTPIKSMSVSITCYNDGVTIGPLIERSFAFLERITADHEVFVVNDGSTDNSYELLESMKEKYPALRVHHHERNMSFGPTFARIYKNTGMQVNGMLPGDAQIEPETLGIMLPHLSEVDLVLGYRRNRADTFRRRLASRCYNFLVRLVSGRPIRDVNTVCVYRTSAMDGVELVAKSAFIHAEFFIRLVRKGVSYKSVEIPHKKREAGEASGGKVDVMIRAAREFFAFLLGRLG